MRFKSSEYSFVPNNPIFVFELGGEAPDKVRVCYAQVKGRDGHVRFGTSTPIDIADCFSVEAFGGNDTSYIKRAVLEGHKEELPPRGASEEQVRLKGKIWVMSSDVKVIYRQLKTSPDDYAHICRIELKPVERAFEPTAPLKTIFCKAIKPIVAPTIDLDGKPRFDEKGNPVMSETMVCPLPANCIKPEWAIEPSMRFMPDEAVGTAHALEKSSAIVHKDQRPSEP